MASNGGGRRDGARWCCTGVARIRASERGFESGLHQNEATKLVNTSRESKKHLGLRKGDAAMHGGGGTASSPVRLGFELLST
jgi:hypothetical protein